MTLYPDYFQVDAKRFVLADRPPRIRVVWDDENIDYGKKCRTQTQPQIKTPNPPAVNRFYPEPREGAGDFRVNLSRPDWKPAIIALNGGGWQGVRRWAYLTGKARATYNGTGWPMQAYLLFSGNELRGEFVGDWFKFVTLKPSDLGRVAGWTIETHPHLVHRFTCVGWDGANKVTKRIPSSNTARGQVYHYVVSREGFGMIPARHVVSA